MPLARAIDSLSPVARIANPRFVDRNQSMSRTNTASTAARTTMETQVPISLPFVRGVNSVVARSSGRFALPMMRRLIE